MALSRAPLAVAAFAFAISTTVNAQNVLTTDMRGQPLVYLKDGRIRGCRIRFLIVDAPERLTDQSIVTTYDVSFNLYIPVLPLVKGGSYDARLGDFKRQDVSKIRPVTPSAIWIKADGVSATTPQQGKVIPADNPGFLFYTTDLDPVLGLFKAFGNNETILVGTSRPGAKTERVFSGTIEMSPSEREQVLKCVRELLANI